MVDNNLVTKYLQGEARYLKRNFGLDLKLGQILFLRRNIISAMENDSEGHFASGPPSGEARAQFFEEYFGIDWADLYLRGKDNKPGHVLFSKLVSQNMFDVDPEFKEYLRRVQERQYEIHGN